MAQPTQRLTSLDFFRGFTMLLLVNAGFLHYFAGSEFDGTVAQEIFKQFSHPEWEGLRFWDLVQPFFMFIVGVAIPFSVSKRLAKGQSWNKLKGHAAQRSVILILLGVALYTTGQDHFTLYFQNVLAQIGVTYIIAFVLIHKRPSWQILISVGLVVLTEVLYRTFPLEGFNQPFVKDQNFGTFFDQLISDGSRGGWVSFNAIPTAAHTIWGVLCGKLLLAGQSDRQKLKTLILAGLITLAVGYSLTTVSPVIKRIATGSFVFISGGYTILALALTYWIIDMKGYKNWAMFGVIVGMNPLFIYLFNHFGFSDVVHQIVEPWFGLVLGWTDATVVEALSRATVWFFNWYLCYLLYKQRIFIRI
ncbi:MAG: DUF5009 domain-containing protein [Bacteroidales bacterium]|nr:DUF5009 domain-containing protein [Bacteroidales bacterium]MBS3775854.1 DUF5009 domain-containing protein [Bacteroidales bacterium]